LAVAEKISALKTEEYLEERAWRGDRRMFLDAIESGILSGVDSIKADRREGGGEKKAWESAEGMSPLHQEPCLDPIH